MIIQGIASSQCITLPFSRKGKDNMEKQIPLFKKSWSKRGPYLFWYQPVGESKSHGYTSLWRARQMQSLDRKILPSCSCVLGTRSMDLHREPVISAHAHVTEGNLTVRRMFSFMYTTDWLQNPLEYSFIRILELTDQYQWWYLFEGGPCTVAKATMGGGLLQTCQFTSAEEGWSCILHISNLLEGSPLRQILQGQTSEKTVTDPLGAPRQEDMHKEQTWMVAA